MPERPVWLSFGLPGSGPGLRSALISSVSGGRVSMATGRCQCTSKASCAGRCHAAVVCGVSDGALRVASAGRRGEAECGSVRLL